MHVKINAQIDLFLHWIMHVKINAQIDLFLHWILLKLEEDKDSIIRG